MKTLYLSAVFGFAAFVPAMAAHAHSSAANCNPCQSHHHTNYHPASVVKRVVISQPHTVFTAPPLGVSYAAPGVSLAGPSLISQTYHRGPTYTEHMPIARAVREVVQGECPAGTQFNFADGTCLMSGWSHTSPNSHSYHRTLPAPRQRVHVYGNMRDSHGHSNTATYCYKNSPKRYDAHGHEIRSGCRH